MNNTPVHDAARQSVRTVRRRAGALWLGVLTLVPVASLLCSPPAPVGRQLQQASGESIIARVQQPIRDEQVDVAALLEQLQHVVDAKPSEALDELRWTIDADAPSGRVLLGAIESMSDGQIVVQRTASKVELRLRSHGAQNNRSAERRQLREMVETGVDRAVRLHNAAGSTRFGVSLVVDDDPPETEHITKVRQAPSHIVLLVHGLDDPGWSWRDMIDHASNDGFDVALFHYPDDGPIADSADLLALSLCDLRSRGVERVSIVAHSMGGLVSRELLTRIGPMLEADGLASALPQVDRLIMLGTPNHGSHLARLQFFSEVGQHIGGLLNIGRASGDFNEDGRGEAGDDLLPGSDFLKRLNARPLPQGTTLTIVAGQASPVTTDAVDDVTNTLRRWFSGDDTPRWLRSLFPRGTAEVIGGMLGGVVDGVGDGLVSIESARLAGVEDFHLVDADHMSMMVNVLSSKTAPPAIPIVMDRLRASREAPLMKNRRR